jgi:small subunit ribosomal protein S16
MVVIRMRKPGKSASGRTHWKIVVIEQGRAREGKFIEEIGHYDPTRGLLKFEIERYKFWLSKGAQPSDSAASLLKRYENKLAGKTIKARKPKAKGKKAEAAA